MITQELLKEAITALFAHHPPKKEISTEKIRSFLAEYLSVPESEIPLENLKSALRQTSFAVAKPMLRGSSRLGWYFVSQIVTEVVHPTKSSKKSFRFKERPIAQTQRLKL